MVRGDVKRDSLRLKEIIRPLVPSAAIRELHRIRRLRYIRRLQPRIDPRRKTILAINHHCDQDYEAIARVCDRFNFVPVIAGTLFMGSSNYFTDAVEFIQAPYDSEPAAHLARYRRECDLIFDRLTAEFPIDLILVPNDNYFFIREFIAVARNHGVRTVVLDKEGIISPHSFNAESARARAFTPFIADHIFVWSHRQKSFWQEKGVPADSITVVGQPRSDLLFLPPGDRVRTHFEHEQPLVTVFSYLDTAYMPAEYVRLKGASWRVMKTETHEIARELAVAYPQFNFVLKCHPLQRDLGDIRDRCQFGNLKVIGGSALGNELILRSELIVGFQTTALIEAMLVGKNVIYTAWDPHIAHMQEHLLPFHRAGGIVVADSPETLQRVARSYLAGDRSAFDFSEAELARRREFVAEYLYQADGNASRRLLVELEKFVP